MSDTIYVYDKDTGRIKYTVDDVSPGQIQSFGQRTDDEFYVGKSGERLAGTYVKKDPSSGKPIGVTKIEHMTFLTINKHTIVANGTDEAVIGGLKAGMTVDIDHGQVFTVGKDDDKTLEISCNNYSYIPEHNHMAIYFKAYGYHDSVIKIEMIEG